MPGHFAKVVDLAIPVNVHMKNESFGDPGKGVGRMEDVMVVLLRFGHSG
jgi:hypothetical protein